MEASLARAKESLSRSHTDLRVITIIAVAWLLGWVGLGGGEGVRARVLIKEGGGGTRTTPHGPQAVSFFLRSQRYIATWSACPPLSSTQGHVHAPTGTRPVVILGPLAATAAARRGDPPRSCAGAEARGGG